MDTPRRNDPCTCGSGRKYKQCCLALDAAQAALATQLQRAQALHQAGELAEAETLYRAILARQPQHALALQLLGLIAHQVGQHAAAVELIIQSLQINPADPEAHNNLGNALNAMGERAEAIACFHMAIRLRPRMIEAHNNLALVLKLDGQPVAAAEAFRAALAIDPAVPSAHFNLALALQRIGRLEEAAGHYRQAIASRPDYADAYSNLGMVWRDLGRPMDAATCFREALRIRPDYPAAINNLGQVLADASRSQEAMALYRQALQLKPDFGDAWNNLGGALLDIGDMAEAAACYDRAAALGIVGAQVRRALMLPPIMGTRDEMLASRIVYEQRIDALMHSGLRIDDPLQQVGLTSFYLAYHGMNDRDLQAKVAQLHLKLCPSLAYTAAHCSRPKTATAPAAPKRIGFLSRFLFNHSVSKCFSRVVTELARRDGFEVCLISLTDVDDQASQRQYAGFDGTRVRLPSDLARARETIAALELDALLYLDIGMDPQSYFLAFARLAPVQCLIGGHPVTSGIPAIDHFISADLMEPPEAQAHYSESLALTPMGVFYFDRPVMPSPMKSRRELGYPDDARLYLCPMKLHKMHPDFDAAIGRILALDPRGLVVLFEDDVHATRHPQLAARFDRSIAADVRDRVVFKPWIRDYADFVSVNAIADVVLDPFHFGVGSTLIATFAARTPIVTWPGQFMRGRVGLGFCRMLDIPECVADSAEDYAQRAVRLASDRTLRDAVSAKIAANDGQIYENLQPIQALADFLSGLPVDG